MLFRSGNMRPMPPSPMPDRSETTARETTDGEDSNSEASGSGAAGSTAHPNEAETRPPDRSSADLSEADLRAIAERFQLPAPVARIRPLGNGNVNRTYLVELQPVALEAVASGAMAFFGEPGEMLNAMPWSPCSVRSREPLPLASS